MTEVQTIRTAATQAKADQLARMAAAKSALAAYWAGSASASVAHHVKRGAVRTVRA
jgi:hypothetical protein